MGKLELPDFIKPRKEISASETPLLEQVAESSAEARRTVMDMFPGTAHRARRDT
jgi:hypothetical protein